MSQLNFIILKEKNIETRDAFVPINQQKILVDKYDNYWVLNSSGGELLKFNSSNKFVCAYTYDMGSNNRVYLAHTIATDSKGRIFIKKYTPIYIFGTQFCVFRIKITRE